MMDQREACRILGVSPGAGEDEIRRAYRRAMRQVHPDNAPSMEDTAAKRLNEAYAFWQKKTAGAKSEEIREEKAFWRAPENPSAYRPREIFQYMEDTEGNRYRISLGRGRFFRCAEEDFSLYLWSLYRLSLELLEEVDSRIGRRERPGEFERYQGELAYLLSAQFMNGQETLEAFCEEQEKGIYVLRAMVERTGEGIPGPGDSLYPLRIRQHRLFVQTADHQEVGYLSFVRDELYYAVIPLMEQRSVQVKMICEGKRVNRGGRSALGVRLYLRFVRREGGALPEQIQNKIEKVLEKYERIQNV